MDIGANVQGISLGPERFVGELTLLCISVMFYVIYIYILFFMLCMKHRSTEKYQSESKKLNPLRRLGKTNSFWTENKVGNYYTHVQGNPEHH